MANCNDCICSDVCYYKSFNDVRALKKRRNDVEKICKSFVHRDSVKVVEIDHVKNAPTVDAVEVVHGRWLYDSGSGKHFCSACDENALSFKKDTLCGGELYEVCLTDYCPNCGAKMDGDGNG